MVVAIRYGEVLMGGCGTQVWWGTDGWLWHSGIVRF